MNKKRWALLLLFCALVFGYIKLFYKTYTETVVPKSADYIVTLDTKRIRNTLIWNIITSPSKWKFGSVFKKGDNTVDWKDMLKIPDYVFAFHISGQPLNTWYVVLQVKDENDFNKGLPQYGFKKLSDNEYESKSLGILLFKNSNQILISHNTAENIALVTNVADELFKKKSFLAKEAFTKIVNCKSHLAVYISKNAFLQEEGVITGNFDENKIELECKLKPAKQFIFTENNFSYSSSSLYTLGFTQPPTALYNLISDTSKSKISNALGLNTDSLFQQSNKYYQLDIVNFRNRIDSAITYTYDDDFNKLEKVIVNNVQEPAYNFTVTGDSIKTLNNYFFNAGKIEQTAAGNLFTPIPFVKSYCAIKNENQLNITAANYIPVTADKNNNAILFFNLLLTKIPQELLNYLAAGLVKAVANIESIQLKAGKQHELLNINCIIQKKKNDLPIINL